MLAGAVPPIPIVVRYFDNFSHSYTELVEPAKLEKWDVRFDGRTATIDFRWFERPLRALLKSWCAFVLGELSPATAFMYANGLRSAPPELVTEIVTSTPQEIRSSWKRLHASECAYAGFEAMKNVLRFLSRYAVGSWQNDSYDLIAQLPLPRRDKYRSVRVGDVFLGASEEAAIVRHIDLMCERLRVDPSSVSQHQVETTLMLLCAYQFGLRPKQIAMLQVNGVRVWNDGLGQFPSVHLTFKVIKQRSRNKVFPMVRRIKREWSPLAIAVLNHARGRGLTGSEHVFDRTPDEVATAIATLAEDLLQDRRTATELRHTAAQRLVDAGATEEELAAFMGHSDLDTGLIYFQSSRSQAERVNSALGISKVYQQVARIAHSRFISHEQLLELKGDQQVAGVPHGIPIAGIGGCTSGQPSCPYNPVLSCYGCSRFMPVADLSVHQQVLEDLRGVVKVFYTASRAERGSPAFQLESTIQTVQSVVDELGGRNELLP